VEYVESANRIASRIYGFVAQSRFDSQPCSVRQRNGRDASRHRPQPRRCWNRESIAEQPTPRAVNRGEVYWADLSPRSGSEQGGRRPVIVISNDAFNTNQHWNSVIVVPISSSDRQRRRGPTAVAIPAGEAGLSVESVALCHQVTTLDRAKLTRFLGRLSSTVLTQVEQGLAIALQLP
jgi:mRNA interferase MazF